MTVNRRNEHGILERVTPRPGIGYLFEGVSDRDLAIMTLRFSGDWENERIAGLFGMTSGAVRHVIHKAKEQFRERQMEDAE